MATVNKFLASQLQTAGIPGRSAAVFSDNREQTATPVPFIETILPGKNVVLGTIGTLDINSNFIPEPNAYIYIYINGFLINPPSLNPDGSYFNKETAVVSDYAGNWKVDTFFFNALPGFQYNQVITFRAKAPMKQMSGRSFPYMIGGMPAPTNLGTFGDVGVLRAPYNGETSIRGDISYWMRHVQDDGHGNWFPVKTGTPLFDCSTHVYVYIDGRHVGNTSTLGEIFRNEVRGTNAHFPISGILNNKVLSLMVDGNQINVPFVQLAPIDTGILVPNTSDPTGLSFIFVQPAPNLGLRLYKNGMRLLEGFDFTTNIQPDGQTGVITLNSAGGVPSQSDDLTILFQYDSGELITGEVPTGVVDGSNAIFFLSKQPRVGGTSGSSVEIYRNGLHLMEGPHFTMNGTRIIFSTDETPESGDLVVVDYQLATARTQFVYTENLTNLYTFNGVRTDFEFSLADFIGTTHVFKNGLLQKIGDPNHITGSTDYVLKQDNVISFMPWSAPEDGDNLIVAFYATPVVLSQIVDYLNSTAQFQNNCLKATSLNVTPLINYEKLLPLPDGRNKYFAFPKEPVSLGGSDLLPVNFRIFRNGMRLTESQDPSLGDYFIDFVNNVIAFHSAPDAGDLLVVLINYITPDFIVGEVPQGIIDGNNDLFKTSLLPIDSTVQVFKNGIRQNPIGGVDYTVSSNVITFTTPPSTGDTLLVDYEAAFTSQIYTTTMIPDGQANGANPKFTFPTPVVGTAVNVYKNGILQDPELDYTLFRTSITFKGNPSGDIGSIPQLGDSILIDFTDASLFTNNPNDQLRIISPYTLDIKRYSTGNFDYVQNLLFGTSVELYPGIDEDGEFRFWISQKNGTWKWTWYDPVSGITTPFTTGQRVTARVSSDSPFIYTVPR